MAIVLGLSSCAVAGRDIAGTPAATCGEFRSAALVVLELRAGEFVSYWCAAPDGLTLPQFEQAPYGRDGQVELLAYPRDGEHHAADDHTGVYGFRGGRPELHVDELCEWVAIPKPMCALD